MAGVCSAPNKTMATTTVGIAVMGLERQVISACGSAVCGDDLAMEVPVRGPAAAPVEASVVATSNRKRRAPSCPPGRPRLGFVAACSLAATFLVVFAVDLALFATPAQAQTTAGVTVSKSMLTVTEEDATGGTYTVVLNSRPTASVTVTVGGYTGSDVTPNPASLTWAPSVWNISLTVTVTAEGDTNTVDETVTLTHSATSTDTDYSGITIASVTVTVDDNDNPNTPPEGTPTISGTAQVGEVLTADPSGITDADGLTTATYTYQWLRGGRGRRVERDEHRRQRRDLHAGGGGCGQADQGAGEFHRRQRPRRDRNQRRDGGGDRQRQRHRTRPLDRGRRRRRERRPPPVRCGALWPHCGRARVRRRASAAGRAAQPRDASQRRGVVEPRHGGGYEVGYTGGYTGGYGPGRVR